jgi:hypothetical protein
LKKLKDEALTSNAEYLATNLHTRLEKERFQMKAFAPTRGIFDDYGALRIQSQLSNYSNYTISGDKNVGNVSNFKKDDTNIFLALDRTPKKEQQDNV